MTISPGDDLDVDFAITKQGKTSQVDFVKVKSVDGNDLDAHGFDRYVKNAVADKNARATPPGKTNGTEQALGKAGGTVGVVAEINDAQDTFKSRGNTVAANMESGMGIAAGAGDTIAMFTGLAGAIVAFRSQGASGSDKAGAVLNGISSIGGGVKGVSSMADKGVAGKDATSAAQGIAGFADAFSGIKDTFFVIKHIVELANEAGG